MLLLTYIALLIAGGCLNMVAKPKAKYIYSLAIVYISLSLIISTCYWLYNIYDVKTNLSITVLKWGGNIGHLILGYLAGNMLMSLTSTNVETENHHINKTVRFTLWGLTILTAVLFITESCWKVQNSCRMINFFTASGYSTWFLYFIMVAEALGGLGLLLHFKLKTGPPAAAGLMLIMIGALYTHRHNNAPFSNSYQAISELITLGIMQLVYYFELITDPKTANYPLPANSSLADQS